jgi:ABC-2 type transport system ATP-binding protein
MTFGGHDISVVFGDTLALDSVDFTAQAGEVTAVVGGDGVGKTTLLRVLVGLVEPSSGIVATPPVEEIGYLPALGGSWKDLTVAQNISFVGGAHGLEGAELASRAAPLLSMADLDGVTDRLASQLSGGMRTKLGFILAILHRPRLVVLDEPTTGIDPVSRVELWRMISDAAAGGAAVVMSTTYMDEAERANSVVMLNRGHVLLEGPPTVVVASLEGAITATSSPTRSEYAWRSGSSFREWWPPGTSPVGEPIEQSLADVSIVAELRAGLAIADAERSP